MSAEKFKEVRDWLEFLTKVAALAGGLFAVWQYLEAKQDDRVVRTFALVEAMEQGEAAKAREAISAELRRRLPELTRIRMTPMPAAVAAEVHARIANALALSSRGGQGLSAEIALILDRFELVQICIDKNLCDEKTAQIFLGHYSYNFWTNFRPYIEQQGRFIPDYGAGLRRFVSSLPAERTR